MIASTGTYGRCQRSPDAGLGLEFGGLISRAMHARDISRSRLLPPSSVAISRLRKCARQHNLPPSLLATEAHAVHQA